jgi:hypothetical protein
MRKNQKYTKVEMYHNIEEWETSGLSQPVYCKKKGFALTTFSFWLQKYRKEKGITTRVSATQFIPVEVISSLGSPISEINISYPSGIRVTCPLSIGFEQLRALVKP